MKIFLFVATLTGLLLGCSPSKNDVDPNDPTVVTATPGGEWVAAKGGGGGFDNFDSFKNFQYNFDVASANQVIGVGLTSPDIDVQYALFDPLGQRIDANGRGRSLSKQYTLNAGKYRVVVTSDRKAVGRFSLTLLGTKDGATRIPFQMLQSDTQNWGTLGGGGLDKTFKNHFYTVEVTEDNFSVDLELESSDTDIELVLYDPLGQKIASDFFNSRYRFKVIAVKKGTYTIMAATDQRGSIGNYRLNVFGKVQNLQRIESQSTTVKGTWTDKNATDTYTLQLTPNTSPLDIDLTSAETLAGIELQTSVGTRITYNVLSAKSNFIVRQDLVKGTYRILVSPSRLAGNTGNYTLSIHGQFTDFKKI